MGVVVPGVNCGARSARHSTGNRRHIEFRTEREAGTAVTFSAYGVGEIRQIGVFLLFWRIRLPTLDLKAYARRGAEAHIVELTAELNDIYRAFPELRRGPGRGSTTAPTARKRRGMSAAQRKAVSRRMKKYWATRRTAKG